MSSVSQTFYVYALARPNGKPFYVGKGSGRRVYDHEAEARRNCRCHKCNVIRKIWKSGGEVQRYILLTTDNEQEAFAYEIETIALYGRKNLCNVTDGGEGPSNPSEAVRAKLRAAMVGRPLSARTREAARATVTNRNKSPEFRAAVSARMKAHLANPDNRAKATARLNAWRDDPVLREQHEAAMKAALARPEVQAKRNAAFKKRSANPEYLAKLGAARKAAWDKPGAREKASATQKIAKLGVRPKVKRSEESKERSRAALKAYAATPEAQAKHREIQANPEYTARISAAVKASWTGPEAEARRAARQTPEYRARMSAAKKAANARRKAEKGN